MLKPYALACSLLAIPMFVPVPITASAQAESLLMYGTAREVVGKITSDLQELIAKARDEGDYLLAQAGATALNSIDAWESANSQLLDEAFSELNRESREVFSRADNLLSKAMEGSADRLETIQQITENANQIVESIPLSGGRSYLLRYQPRIQPPNAEDQFTIRVRGVNLGKANPELQLSEGTAERVQPSELEAQFLVPVSESPVDQKTLRVNLFEVTYTTESDSFWGRLWGDQEVITRSIPMVALPEDVAELELEVTRQYERREEDTFETYLGQFKARNARVYKTAKPKHGWQWDLSKGEGAFTYIQGEGKKGTCGGVDMHRSNPDGMSFQAHLDERGVYPTYPGYVNCTLVGPIFRNVPVTENVVIDLEELGAGVLHWTEDISIPLPPDTVEVRLSAQTFDHRRVAITNTGSDRFFSVSKEGERLVIAPQVPEDIHL